MTSLSRLLLVGAALACAPLAFAQSYSDAGAAPAGGASGATPAIREIGYAFMQTAKLNPKAYKDLKTGPFKLPFVGEPKLVKGFAVRANVPAQLTAMQQEGYVLAALRVSPEGKVTQIGIFDASPKGVVEQAAQEFFSQVAYQPEKRKGQAIEFETNVFLAFKFVAAPTPGRKR